jgi:hypothetical protein
MAIALYVIRETTIIKEVKRKGEKGRSGTRIGRGAERTTTSFRLREETNSKNEGRRWLTGAKEDTCERMKQHEGAKS